MRKCNSEFRDLGGWIRCDHDECSTRVYEYVGAGEYGWVETKREPCARATLPPSAAPPADVRTPIALALFLVICVVAKALAARDARELEAERAGNSSSHGQASDHLLAAEVALARNRRMIQLLEDNPAAATRLARARAATR